MTDSGSPPGTTRRSDGTVVVHVTESFASGTASAIADFVRNHPEAGHHLLYALRPEAAIHPDEFGRFESAVAMPAGTWARVRFLRRHVRRLVGEDPRRVVVHAHSSKAGAYVRTAVRRSRRLPVIYTPHCYAFERLDVPWPVRQAFRAVEWLLSFNTTAYGACSAREADLSRWAVSAPAVVTVPNVRPPGLPERGSVPVDRKLRIIGNGRIGPQKDPRFFAEAVAAAAAQHPGIRAVWVGGGEARYIEEMTAAGIEVTGWLPRAEALDVMATGDVYLHTALWEGFPISIMEAVGMGLPVVSRRRPYLAGVELPIVVDHPADFATAITALLEDGALDELRARCTGALAGHTDTDQRSALDELYGVAIGDRR